MYYNNIGHDNLTCSIQNLSAGFSHSVYFILLVFLTSYNFLLSLAGIQGIIHLNRGAVSLSRSQTRLSTAR